MNKLHQDEQLQTLSHCSLSVASPTDLTDITFRPVDQSRYPEILELLYANFHTDEPMSRALKIYDGKSRIPSVDEFTLNALNEKLSIMAIDSFTNKLLGERRCKLCKLNECEE